jgi:uncharacterized protein YggL (DUF469 family)
VFLGHGDADEKKPYALGHAAAETLQALGFDVTWRLYQNLGHWYKVPDEIDDIVNFIQNSVGWSVASSCRHGQSQYVRDRRRTLMQEESCVYLPDAS